MTSSVDTLCAQAKHREVQAVMLLRYDNGQAYKPLASCNSSGVTAPFFYSTIAMAPRSYHHIQVR